MLSLVWKEWTEQAWKLAIASILFGMIALIGLHTRMMADAVMLAWVGFLAMLLLPTMAATGLVPAERAEGTLAALLSLPVAPAQVLASKTAIGLLLCGGPLLTAMLVSLVVAGGREMSAAAIVGLYLRTFATVLSLFIWMLAFTVRLPNEARAALICVGVFAFWLMASIGLRGSSIPASLQAALPFAFTVDFQSDLPAASPSLVGVPLHPGGRASLLLVVAIQLAIAVALWLWAAKRLPDPTPVRV